jgi:hypothetical protein
MEKEKAIELLRQINELIAQLTALVMESKAPDEA